MPLIHTLEALNQHNSPRTRANPVVPVRVYHMFRIKHTYRYTSTYIANNSQRTILHRSKVKPDVPVFEPGGYGFWIFHPGMLHSPYHYQIKRVLLALPWSDQTVNCSLIRTSRAAELFTCFWQVVTGIFQSSGRHSCCAKQGPLLSAISRHPCLFFLRKDTWCFSFLAWQVQLIFSHEVVYN